MQSSLNENKKDIIIVNNKDLFENIEDQKDKEKFSKKKKKEN